MKLTPEIIEKAMEVGSAIYRELAWETRKTEDHFKSLVVSIIQEHAEEFKP